MENTNTPSEHQKWIFENLLIKYENVFYYVFGKCHDDLSMEKMCMKYYQNQSFKTYLKKTSNFSIMFLKNFDFRRSDLQQCCQNESYKWKLTFETLMFQYLKNKLFWRRFKLIYFRDIKWRLYQIFYVE